MILKVEQTLFSEDFAGKYLKRNTDDKILERVSDVIAII